MAVRCFVNGQPIDNGATVYIEVPSPSSPPLALGCGDRVRSLPWQKIQDEAMVRMEGWSGKGLAQLIIEVIGEMLDATD